MPNTILKNSSNKTYTKIVEKLFVTLTILIGLVITVFLAGSVSFLKSNAVLNSVNSAQIYLSPDSVDIPPDATISVMVNPYNQTISFISATLHYDPTVLQLSSAVSTSTSPLKNFSVSSLADANTTGNITIVETQVPGTSIPNQPFEIATIKFTAVNPDNLNQSDITIIDEETQMVNDSTQEVVFSTGYTTINAPRSSTGGRLMATNQGADTSNCPTIEGYIDTAIGCIPYGNPQALAAFFLTWGLGIAGGIALILIVYSSFLISTSQGDPHRLQVGKELLTAAFMGLIMLVFSAFILRMIGVDFLGIL